MVTPNKKYSSIMSSIWKKFAAILMLFSVVSCAINQSGGGFGETDMDDIEVDPGITQAFDRALALLKQEKYDAAIKLLEDVTQREKRLPAPFVNLGMAYSKNGDNKRAKRALVNAVELDEYHPIANNELGLVYRKLGNFDEAKKVYKNVLSKYPEYLPAIKNLGILCDLYMQDLGCALANFEQYLKYAPDDKTVSVWVTDVKRRMSK